jgi:multiple sugar transport system substrate-binding protein
MEFSSGAYPALISALSSPTLNSPQPFFGNQVINQVFSSSSKQVNVNFQWGPSMEQVYNDMGDQFANAANGHGTLSDGLNAVQQSTITYMKKQGFSVTS